MILSVNNKINHCLNKRQAVCDDSFGPDLRKKQLYMIFVLFFNKMLTALGQMYSC